MGGRLGGCHSPGPQPELADGVGVEPSPRRTVWVGALLGGGGFGAAGWLAGTGVGLVCPCWRGFTADCRAAGGGGAGALIVMCATCWMGPGSAPV